MSWGDRRHRFGLRGRGQLSRDRGRLSRSRLSRSRLLSRRGRLDRGLLDRGRLLDGSLLLDGSRLSGRSEGGRDEVDLAGERRPAHAALVAGIVLCLDLEELEGLPDLGDGALLPGADSPDTEETTGCRGDRLTAGEHPLRSALHEPPRRFPVHLPERGSEHARRLAAGTRQLPDHLSWTC